MDSHQRARRTLATVRGRFGDAAALARLQPGPPEPLPAAGGWLDADLTPAGIERRWQALAASQGARAALLDPATAGQAAVWQASIESFIGTVKIPVGVVGPLRINGLWAHGSFRVPLATTEAALVASYNRGAALLTAAGGAVAALLAEGVPRTPCFAFSRLPEAGAFVAWVLDHLEAIQDAAHATTGHGRLLDLTVSVEGNHVYLGFVFATADAAGQNMTTFATEAACRMIAETCPVTPQAWFLDGNMSGDKKASAASLQSVRGRKVTAEATLPAALVERVLGCRPEAMERFWRVSVLGGVMSGTIGVQGHYANGLAALYLATGQDAACVAESAVGITRMELGAEGALYAAVTLPNIVVGTVGGGTALPSQRACLDVMGLAGPGKAAALAEVAAALCLAGELSLIGAFAAGNFGRAHALLARRRRNAAAGSGGQPGALPASPVAGDGKAPDPAADPAA